ncbi:MAG: hypothetical protein FJ317_06365 [SAR202 cluster bacterium]|nr:hypothetical protein [SAR202 cluster bacterium]
MAALLLAALAAACATPEPSLSQFASDRISCTPEEMADTRRHQEVLLEVRDRYRNELVGLPHAIGAGVGLLADKNGELTKEIGIVVGYRKEDVERLGTAATIDRLPKTLEGCKVGWYVTDPVRDFRETVEIER